MHMGDDIPAAILCAAGDPLPPATTSTEKDLTPAVNGVAVALADSRRFVKTFADLNAGKPLSRDEWPTTLPADHPYRRVLEARAAALQREREMTRLGERYALEEEAARKESRLSLEKYCTEPDRNEKLCAEIRAAFDRGDLEQKFPDDQNWKELTAHLALPDSKWLRAFRGKLKNYIKEMKRFSIANPGAADKEKNWSKERMGKWEACDMFLEVLEKEPNRPDPGNNLFEAFREYGRLFAAIASQPEVQDLVRQRIVRLCESHLPPEMKLDRKVMVGIGRNAQEVDRSMVSIHWKDDVKEKMKDKATLDTSGFDEFDTDWLKNVEQFTVNKKNTQKPALAPTPLSQAAREYNAQRKSMKWTAADLKKLNQLRLKYKDVDAPDNAWERIENLYKAASACPEIFGKSE